MILIVQIEVEPKDEWTVRGDYLVTPDAPIDQDDVSSQLYTPTEVVNSLRNALIDATKHSDVDAWRVISVTIRSYHT